MDFEFFIRRLQSNADVIRYMSKGVPDEQARLKPASDSWSMLEVINHLADEEKEDFRVRMEYTLYKPKEPWPPIDPGGRVVQLGYNQRDFMESLDSFLIARAKSIEWLQELGNPNWNSSHVSPTGKSMAAGDIFASWVGHDWLHMRQLIELQRHWTVLQMSPYRLDYAGEW